MLCPHCGNSYIRRSRRRGLQDRVAAWLNRWPYRCESCFSRFWADRRQHTPTSPPRHKPPPRGAVARIELHATSQAQLDEMLLSLNQALTRFQKTAPNTEPELSVSLRR